MKIRAIALALVMILTPTTKAAANPCSAVLCMFGMIAGGGNAGQCASSTSEFFSIQVWNWWGFDPVSTAIARRAFLNGCGGGVGGQIDNIIAVFGEVP
ncbi:TrbM/KikA/MpfK family conjugal transfer protein [Methylomonas sp. AM2-LC]|uniref:TrbM/KikA/MpfK family conjugal transfer protein n=1 Tax=Methylomonas sp. AM2-LC TaxID=3153301 RepID=UPI00326394A0